MNRIELAVFTFLIALGGQTAEAKSCRAPKTLTLRLAFESQKSALILLLFHHRYAMAMH